MFGFGSAVFGLRRDVRLKKEALVKEKEESTRRLYEVSILKEIGDRAGYSLDVEEILEIISGSLHQLVEYSAAAYFIIGEDKLNLAIHLERSVSHDFLNGLKSKMLSSLDALSETDFNKYPVEEKITGAVIADAVTEPVGSFFNIPLVIEGALAALLTVSHVKVGLYKEEDMTVLYKIVGQATAAVARLRAVVRREDERLNKVREEFTSMIVHELRSPLDGIRKIVELIAANKIKGDSKEFGEYIKLVYQSSTSMLELVNDILDYSKLQAGKFEIHKEEAVLKETIENRIDFYKVSADTKNIKLALLADLSVPALIRFDPRAIKQVLNNLISNALKFTPEGGSIEVKVSLKGPFVLVSVVDTGIGIAPDKVKDLFLKYKQISHSPIYSEDKGTGLGLVIAKGIIEAHGGEIGVNSSESKGSTFYFTLPI